MYLFFRAKAPIHLIFDPNPLRQNFFCPCQSGGILFKGIKYEYYRTASNLIFHK